MIKVHVPPIKSQGIKTKLVPWIKEIVDKQNFNNWVEPFMGTGVVGFNINNAKNYIFSDSNPHLIQFYKDIKNQIINKESVKQFLEQENKKLLMDGDYYYEVRERFNENHQSLDFLFLNRACFNGMIRFNRKGNFNVPFCKKPNRFAQAYITKICNQIQYIEYLFNNKTIELSNYNFESSILTASSNDIIYCDPPYIDRHADYYNGWGDNDENKLFVLLSETKSKFILSTWHHNQYRKNEYIDKLWKNFNVLTKEHYYHLGGLEKNRGSMIEAIITNIDT